MNPVHLPLNYIETIKGTGGDYDGQVACNCTILKGRVKRGPGKGQPTFRVRAYFDLETLRSNPLAVVHVTEEGLDTLQGCVESLRAEPLTDEEFVSFLKGDMLNAKLVATDKDGKEIDLTTVVGDVLGEQTHDQALLEEYLENSGGLTDVHAIHKPIVERPAHSYRAVIEGLAKESDSE